MTNMPVAESPCQRDERSAITRQAWVVLREFSRKAIHQDVHLTETGDLAAEFTGNAIAASGGARPGYIHAVALTGAAARRGRPRRPAGQQENGPVIRALTVICPLGNPERQSAAVGRGLPGPEGP